MYDALLSGFMSLWTIGAFRSPSIAKQPERGLAFGWWVAVMQRQQNLHKIMSYSLF